ncbi:hypothetical protein HNP72_001291 [Sphingobacterium soli]|nr:hypothetical protein [Sphingobacterium soli]
MKLVSEGFYDMEPDVFEYSFGGMTGKLKQQSRIR